MKETKINVWEEKIEVLTLRMDVPIEKYDDKLVRLFNNKRENDEILELYNYYDSNEIAIYINLTKYLKEGNNNGSKEDAIKHLKEWFRGDLDISLDSIQETLEEGHLYTVMDYTLNTDNNYIKLEI